MVGGLWKRRAPWPQKKMKHWAQPIPYRGQQRPAGGGSWAGPGQCKHATDSAGELSPTRQDPSSSPGGVPRPTRPSNHPARFDDYLCYSARPSDAIIDSSIATSPQQKSSGTRYTIANYVSFERFTESHNNFLAALTKTVKPKHFQEAAKDPLWQKPMAKEIRALEANNT